MGQKDLVMLARPPSKETKYWVRGGRCGKVISGSVCLEEIHFVKYDLKPGLPIDAAQSIIL